MNPKLSWIIDQAFSFTENVLEKEYGLDPTTSIAALLVLILVASYLLMIILNQITSVFSFKQMKYFSSPNQLQRFAFNEAGGSNME
jgi:hypothetical protein